MHVPGLEDALVGIYGDAIGDVYGDALGELYGDMTGDVPGGVPLLGGPALG